MSTTTVSEEFYEDMIALLSGTLVDVELENEDVAKAYKQAKRVWKQKGNVNLERAFYKMTVKPKQMTYQLPEDVIGVNEIIHGKGEFGHVAEDPFAMATFQEVFTYGMGGSISGDFFMIYDLTKQVMDNNKIYLASEPNFRFDKRKKTITLYNPPRIERDWLVDVYKEPSEEDFEDNLWIRNWTIAECKQMLGAAYRKLGSLPSPTGESQLGGDQLIQESQQEKERLLEDIDSFVDGEATGLGVYIG